MTRTWSLSMHWDTKFWGCNNLKELYWKGLSLWFFSGFNAEFDQVRVQIIRKELPTLNETFFVIWAEESRRSSIHLGSVLLLTLAKENIQALILNIIWWDSVFLVHEEGCEESRHFQLHFPTFSHPIVNTCYHRISGILLYQFWDIDEFSLVNFE